MSNRERGYRARTATTGGRETMPENRARRAIVTGADSGIGRATAQLLAREGHDVGVTFHTDEQGARDTVTEVERRGQRGFLAHQDLAARQAAGPIDWLVARLSGLDVLVNCGGVGLSASALDMSYDDWRRVVATDLDGPFLCAQAAARHMVEQRSGGRIVNVTSVHEHVPRAGSAAYCSAKAALGMMTKVLALELAEHGILVNSVAPGEIATDMTGMKTEEAYDTDR